MSQAEIPQQTGNVSPINMSPNNVTLGNTETSPSRHASKEKQRQASQKKKDN